MGKKSVSKNKSYYQEVRENLGLSRSDVHDNNSNGMTEDRLERIENKKATMFAEDALVLADIYDCPKIINYYCAHDCKIGKEGYVKEVKPSDLAMISVSTLNAVNKLSMQKERLLEIVEDGEITPDEYDDFNIIKDNMERIYDTVNSLKLWIDEAISSGSMKGYNKDKNSNDKSKKLTNKKK